MENVIEKLILRGWGLPSLEASTPIKPIGKSGFWL
jgi:hypothetical protein